MAPDKIQIKAYPRRRLFALFDDRKLAVPEEFRRRKHFARVMRGHLVPHRPEGPAWHDNIRRAFREFCKQRLKLICESFEAQAGMKLFRREKRSKTDGYSAP